MAFLSFGKTTGLGKCKSCCHPLHIFSLAHLYSTQQSVSLISHNAANINELTPFILWFMRFLNLVHLHYNLKLRQNVKVKTKKRGQFWSKFWRVKAGKNFSFINVWAVVTISEKPKMWNFSSCWSQSLKFDCESSQFFRRLFSLPPKVYFYEWGKEHKFHPTLRQAQ